MSTKAITVQAIEEAESGTVYRATHHDDPAGFTVWVRVREKREGIALVCTDSTNPELVGLTVKYTALSRMHPSEFKRWRKIGVVPGTSADKESDRIASDALSIDRWVLMGPDDEPVRGPSYDTQEEAIEAAKKAGPTYAVLKNGYEWTSHVLAWAPEWERS